MHCSEEVVVDLVCLFGSVAVRPSAPGMHVGGRRALPDRLCVLVIAQETSWRGAAAGACSEAAVPITYSVPLADMLCELHPCAALTRQSVPAGPQSLKGLPNGRALCYLW